MTQAYENNFGVIQNANVLGLAVIMVMASFVGSTASTLGTTSSSGIQPLSGSGYTGFPDYDADSGKFLGIAGGGTIENVPIILHIGVSSDESDFDVDVFDGEIGGRWDQIRSGSDYMDFELYEDPLKDLTGTNLVASWTQYDMVDNDWYLRSFSTSSGAQAPSGNYFYRMEVKWRSPGSSSSNNYFKVRTTGQISIAQGNIFAIMGGPQNPPSSSNPDPPWEIYGWDPPVGAGDPDPDVNNIDANSYDGEWNFHFYVPRSLTSITFQDGDADRADDTDDPNTPNTDPDGGGPLRAEGVNLGNPRDGPSPLYGCNVNPSIKYTIIDPDLNEYENSDPSGDMEWENFIISNDPADTPDYLAGDTLSAGLWHMKFEGMDAHNMNFIEASHEIFTITEPPLPVNPPPTLVPPLSTTVSPGANVYFGHTLTNNGVSDTFDLSATSDHDWTTRIYHDADGDGVLDSSEESAGEISQTSLLGLSESFDIVVKLEVPSGIGGTTDYTTVTGSSQTEWNIQASLTDTTNVQANQPPVADPGGPYSCDEGDTIQLDGSGSYDPDGDPLDYYWDLDNDGSYGDSTSIYPDFYRSEDGLYTVRLAVFDGTVYDFESTTVNVGNLPPEIYSTTYVYTLTQGSFSTTIPAIETATSGASFYNYYSASSHTGYETASESKIMLHRDITTDDVTLIVTHNIDYFPGGEHTGAGAVFFDFDGIPTDAYVSASDDPLHEWTSCPLGSQTHGSPYSEFDLAYDYREGEWYYVDNTDGGSLSGLPTDESWDITITPEGFYNIDSWVYHFATGEDIVLDMSLPVTISYSSQTEPGEVETDEGTPITIGAFARDWGSDDNPLDYEFDWADSYAPGVTSSGTTPWDTLFTATHIYYEDGTYYPVLTVTDSDDATDTFTFTVIVNNIEPSVNAGPDKTVDEGTLLSVSGSFSDPGAYDTHTASWDWGDTSSSAGTVTEENTPPYSTGTVSGSHTYMDDGSYIATLSVWDDESALGQDSLRVTVNDLGPSAEFSMSPSPQDEGSPVQFTDLSTSYPDAIVSWQWDFGGLGTSTLQHPQFTFMDDGVYSISLTVTDDDGSTSSISYDIVINDLAPIPDFEWPSALQYEGSPVPFTDLSYSYPDVIVSWEWDFGDSGTSSLQHPSHTYGDNDDYTVTLTVTDDDGSTASISYIVIIHNVAPEVEAGGDQETDEGTTISFSGSFFDPGWLDTHTIEWDFGDGNTETGTLNTIHAYGDNGLYQVILTVTDDDGGVGSDFLYVTVNNVAPSVEALEDQEMDEGTSVSLVLASFTDPGWLDTHTATIDWGDGTVEAGTVTEISGNGTVSGSHTYGDDGVFTVTITVTDDDGDSGSDQLTIIVWNVAPELGALEQSYVTDENVAITLAGHATDPGSDDLTFTWNWGDGTSDTVTIYYNNGVSPDPDPSTEFNPMNITDVVSHTYGDNGVFVVILTVEDDDGGLDVFNITVTVHNVAPEVDPGGPYVVDENTEITFNGRGIDLGSDDLTFTWEFELGPTITNVYYNNGVSPDPYPSPEINPVDITDVVTHTYGDNGNFTVTLTVEDDDAGITVVTFVVVVRNVAPAVINIETYMYVNFSLRVAGEKWHSVGIFLSEDDSEIWAATVTRYPGDPDEQKATITNVRVDLTKSYTVLVDYLPNDPRINGNVWGGNPVWIDMEFEDGSTQRLHHTFNVRQSDWDSDHWNHIDPWEVEINPHLVGHNITFEATATDPGSDDLTFFWDFGDNATSGPNTYFNNGVSADPFPSPEINPMTATDTAVHYYSTSGTFTITLTVTDDDGGTTTFTLVLLTG